MACKSRLKKAKVRAKNRAIKERIRQAKRTMLTCPNFAPHLEFDYEADHQEYVAYMNWLKEI